MVERLILHIGAHKTGTTAIQASLERSASSLGEQGVLYPRAGRAGPEAPGHARLARELLSDRVPAEDVPSHRALLAEVRASHASTVIVSSEDLSLGRSRRPVEWAELLSRELEAREQDVVAYVRPQWEYLESSYTQRIREGSTWRRFEDFVDWALGDGMAHRLDYVVRFGPWREAFGEALSIRPYRAGTAAFDVVHDFWSALGLGWPSRDEPPPGRRDRRGLAAWAGGARALAAGGTRGRSEALNRRTGERTTEMLRTLRERLAEQGVESPDEARPLIARARARLERELGDDPPFRGLSPELVARVADRFAASNAVFVRDFLGGRHADLFEPPTHVEAVARPWSLADASRRERRIFERVAREALEARAASR